MQLNDNVENDNPQRPIPRTLNSVKRQLKILETEPRRKSRRSHGDDGNRSTLFDKYILVERIAQGAYGAVYRGVTITGRKQQVAVKKIKEDALDSPDSEGISATTLREISLLRELDHENIIKLIDVHVDRRVYLVFELGTQDLSANILDFKCQIPAETIKTYVRQILSGMDHCHGRRIMHRDLKPANIFLSYSGELKIGDFGLGRTVAFPMKTYTHEVQTLWYRAPEVLLGGPTGKYSFAADVFSIGCIFAELVIKKPLFPGQSEIEQLMYIFQVNGTPLPTTWPGVEKYVDYSPIFPKFKKPQLSLSVPGLDDEGVELLDVLLCNRPDHRLSCKQALAHKYFKDETIKQHGV